MRRKLFIIALMILVMLFVIMPDAIKKGADEGLLLWFQVIIPSMLPFMILSGILVKLNVTEFISRVFYPVLRKILKISKESCYPVVIGMLSGYPLGAKTVADIYLEGAYSKEEAQYLIGICNNASPMFLIEYIGAGCLGLKEPIILLIIIYLSAFINALLEQNKNFSNFQKKENIRHHIQKYSVMQAVDESIFNSIETILKIGGYIILFSIITKVIQIAIPVKIVTVYLSCILEIATGAMMLSGLKIDIILKCVLMTAFCAFGGLSSVAQTASVISQAKLSVKRYIFVKIRQSFIAAALACIWFFVRTHV